MRWASCARITARERVTTLEVQRDGTYRAERALGRAWVDLPGGRQPGMASTSSVTHSTIISWWRSPQVGVRQCRVK